MQAPGLTGAKWIVAKVNQISAGGEWTIDDVRETFRQQIIQEKMINQVVEDLREMTYIEVRFEGTPITQ